MLRTQFLRAYLFYSVVFGARNQNITQCVLPIKVDSILYGLFAYANAHNKINNISIAYRNFPIINLHTKYEVVHNARMRIDSVLIKATTKVF